MIPKSFSASALQTASLCMARYKAENIDRTPSIDNSAAATGTAVHYALEHFVRFCVLEKHPEAWKIPILERCYKEGYTDTFHNSDFTSAEYEDGWELCKIWFKRSTHVRDTNVLSCEVKSNFMVNTVAGEIPLNYIWDRCDRISETEITVVDYKTIRRALTPDDLRKKIQPRVYALAAQIQFPEAQTIWVEFDLLRHTSVGRKFTREDNIATWEFLKREANRIIETDELNPPETLNTECNFCIRKASCTALSQNTAAGGMVGMGVEDAARKLLLVQAQLKALTSLSIDLDKQITNHAENDDVLDYDFGDIRVDMKISSRRGITDQAEIASILGPDLARENSKFSVTDLDNLIKSERVDADQAKRIKSYIRKNYGDPKATVSLKSPLEVD